MDYVNKGNEPKRYVNTQNIKSTNFNDFSDTNENSYKVMDRKKKSEFSEKYSLPSEEIVHV